MIFNTYLGNVSTSQDKIRLVVAKSIKTKEQYDTIIQSLSKYLFDEGFMMSRAETRLDGYTSPEAVGISDIKHILSELPAFWHLELYDKRNRLIKRESFVA